MTEFPSRWEVVPLADLMDGNAPIIYGILQPGPDLKDGVLYVRPTEIVDDQVRVDRLRRTSPEIAAKYDRAKLSAGDVLLSIVGTIGKVALVPPELTGANITQSSVRVRVCSEHVENSYVAWFLRSPAATTQYKKRLLGTGVPRLNVGHVRELSAPLAPLNEQRRIVAKVESLFERSRRAKEALDAIPPLLDKLRQSILAAAFRGDLTADWRAQNPDVEPADKLLERIRTERRHRWEQAELAKMRAKGKEPKNDKWKAKYKEPEPPSIERPAHLPDSWGWTTVEQTTSMLTDGEHQTPQRSDSGVLLLSARNVHNGRLDLSKVDHVPREVHEQLCRRLQVEAGDVLLSCSGTVGRSCVVPDDIEFSLVRSAAVLRPCGVNSDVMSLALRSPRVQAQISRRKTQTAQSNLFQGKIKILALPVPPPGEQELLATRVVQALSRVRAISARVASQAQQVEIANSSVLAKAFRGELVEQDPNDEPASVLLERIRAAREAAKPAKKKRGKRTVGGKKTASVES